MDWVGEWHTHPGGLAKPSLIDRQSWMKLAVHTGSPMAFMIFNDTQTYLGLQATSTNAVTELRVIEHDAEGCLYVA